MENQKQVLIAEDQCTDIHMGKLELESLDVLLPKDTKSVAILQYVLRGHSLVAGPTQYRKVRLSEESKQFHLNVQSVALNSISAEAVESTTIEIA